MNSDFMKMLAAMEGESKVDTTESTPKELKKRFDLYNKKHEFKPGDLVQWKDGLRNRKRPQYSEPGIVVEVVPGQIDPETDGGTPYYHELIDLKVGIIYDGGFRCFHFDSARFEPYSEF